MYDLDTFNRASQEETLVLSYPVWEDVHPDFVHIPVAWEHSSTYGLMCAHEMPPKVVRFLETLIDTFGTDNTRRSRQPV